MRLRIVEGFRKIGSGRRSRQRCPRPCRRAPFVVEVKKADAMIDPRPSPFINEPCWQVVRPGLEMSGWGRCCRFSPHQISCQHAATDRSSAWWSSSGSGDNRRIQQKSGGVVQQQRQHRLSPSPPSPHDDDAATTWACFGITKICRCRRGQTCLRPASKTFSQIRDQRL
jgi:hypothetical protein